MHAHRLPSFTPFARATAHRLVRLTAGQDVQSLIPLAQAVHDEAPDHTFLLLIAHLPFGLQAQTLVPALIWARSGALLKSE